MADTIAPCPECDGDSLDDKHSVERDGDEVVIECGYGSKVARMITMTLERERPSPGVRITNQSEPASFTVADDFTIGVDTTEMVRELSERITVGALRVNHGPD